MQNKQRYITAGVTIAAAAVTAHMMQRDSGDGKSQVGVATAAVISTPSLGSDTAPVPKQNEVTVVAASVPDSKPTPSTEDAPIVLAAAVPADTAIEGGDTAQSEETSSSFPTPPSDTLTPSPLPSLGSELPSRVAETSSAPVTPLVEDTERNEFGLSCGPILSGSALPQGLVNLTLTAPCRGDERIEIEHGPIAFSGVTDSTGTYLITVPALTEVADFKVTFADGSDVFTTTDVKGVTDLDRVGIVSGVTSGFQIHALEFGADYGEPGHIWSENPGDLIAAATDGGGYMLGLGDVTLDNATIAEVYTFPREGSSNSGVVRLSVEAEVTAQNCATEIAGHSIEPGPSGVPLSMSMTVAMPDCDAIGEFLVLKNLLRDLRIASN